MISKYHFMTLHFMAKPCQDYCNTKVWKQQTTISFVVTTNRNALWFSKNWQKGECHIIVFWISLVVFTLTPFPKWSARTTFLPFLPHFDFQIYHKTGRIFGKNLFAVVFLLRFFWFECILHKFPTKKNPKQCTMSDFQKRQVKVSKSQKHFLLKLHCPKNEQNIRQNSALWS